MIKSASLALIAIFGLLPCPSTALEVPAGPVLNAALASPGVEVDAVPPPPRFVESAASPVPTRRTSAPFRDAARLFEQAKEAATKETLTGWHTGFMFMAESAQYFPSLFSGEAKDGAFKAVGTYRLSAVRNYYDLLAAEEAALVRDAHARKRADVSPVDFAPQDAAKYRSTDGTAEFAVRRSGRFIVVQVATKRDGAFEATAYGIYSDRWRYEGR
ncbi:MAG: hypothetical protein HY078_05155 [Elusimicrobia bacterium]|nr:hypothetical protein [Elusimicrobiota bacterium]